MKLSSIQHIPQNTPMKTNLGSTSLRGKKREHFPMNAYDKLPAPLRGWLCEAVLPWSPKSAKRIWVKALSKGKSAEGALMALQNAEERTLARDKHRVLFK